MRRRGPRALRVVRYRVRRFLRRLDRDTPEWLRWLTPWGVSLVFHSALLVVLGVFVYVATDDGRLQGPKFDTSLPANQLVEDVIAAAPAEKAGDTFTTAQTPEPPSFSAHPDEKSEIFAVPESFLPIGDGSGILAPPPIASAEASLKKSLGPGNLKIAEPAVPFSGRSSTRGRSSSAARAGRSNPRRPWSSGWTGSPAISERTAVGAWTITRSARARDALRAATPNPTSPPPGWPCSPCSAPGRTTSLRADTRRRSSAASTGS